jgi:hypothetical protein
MLIHDPRRAKDLMLMLDPKEMKSITLTPLPMRAIP